MAPKRKLSAPASETASKTARLVKPVDRFEPGAGKDPKSSASKPLGKVVVAAERMPLPARAPNGNLVFKDFPDFRPNLTPKEVMQAGSFGGTYFRPIRSGVTGQTYTDAWQEFPADWFQGLSIPSQVASPAYREEKNKYKVSCGGDLDMWESSGWIADADPYGWFQWYCRFYLGRRCSDDARQVGRGNGVIGPKGRWRNNLANKCLASGAAYATACEDARISPKVRQLLQHWGYALTVSDLEAAAARKK